MAKFNVPTSAEIGAAMKVAALAAARIVAWFIVAARLTYEYGYRAGRALHSLNDWLADASKRPAATVLDLAGRAMAWADLILTEAEPPTPILSGPELIKLWGAEILPDEPKKKPARRKPARATKVKAAG